MLKNYCECWYWAYEVKAARDHHQLYIRTKPKYMSEGSFRDIIKKHVIRPESKGNRAYGVSPVRGVEGDDEDPVVVLVCYLMKENRLKESCNMYVDVLRKAEERQTRILDAQEERKKKKKGTVLERLLQDIDYVSSSPDTDRELAYAIVNWHIREKRLVPDQYMLRKYITSIRMYKESGKVSEYVEGILRMWDPWARQDA